jgi:type II secretory pathway pseudopilin PulG
VPFLPLECLAVAIGARTLAAVLPEWGRRPRAWIGVLALLVLPSALPALKDAAVEARRQQSRLGEERALIARAIGHGPAPAGAVVLSDTPDFVAWTSGWPAVWMSIEEYDALPPCAADGSAPAPDRPCRGTRTVPWFHRAGVP